MSVEKYYNSVLESGGSEQFANFIKEGVEGDYNSLVVRDVVLCIEKNDKDLSKKAEKFGDFASQLWDGNLLEAYKYADKTNRFILDNVYEDRNLKEEAY